MNDYKVRISRKVHNLFLRLSGRFYSFSQCTACGSNTGFEFKSLLHSKLIEDWGLTASQANYFDLREGLKCKQCKSNIRANQLAISFLDYINQHTKNNYSSLKAFTNSKEFDNYSIAEINSVEGLHQFLENKTNVAYSEYNSTLDHVPSEDLTNLSYGDNQFDLVLNSDVLEHVPDIETALSEIYRVLKNGGAYIFTVPVIPNRKTKIRAEIKEGKLFHNYSASYHGNYESKLDDYIVFYEFGDDFYSLCKKFGFHISTSISTKNPYLIAIICLKENHNPVSLSS